MQQLQINLNANGVAAPAQRAAWQCSEVVTFCLQSAAAGDLSKQPEIVTKAMTYKFSGPDMTAAERFTLYENWLLAKSRACLAVAAGRRGGVILRGHG